MNAHVIAYAEFHIIRRASLIELRDARRISRRTGNTTVDDAISTEIMRRLSHAEG